ncbi:class I SAM-dependent methyltransferase [Mycobacterium helveticum]|uniref:S-adenosyl-L-methionine-dependent methyltransferase n=1 Tax=Mycobacterium helveticum TaxID=2592811 RepID=A0A557XHR1_9MYCO|nr:class I SAM-dependent methyltransferase [Mycobacterium helveticum]TVS83398.1 class I SAM-dependent methyltransferase [Mycobacterium helveticum]TVS85224.1 class I SAM-dependent methyltransferase [Mycobacterium helveticum]
MARTDDDTWDLATSVGSTATMVAAARAAATRRGVINDPFAEPLVRAVGLDFFTRVAEGEADLAEVADDAWFRRMTDVFAARARYYDDFFNSASAAGVRQVVIVASGLDSRAYRLSWPAGTTVYEVDQPEVIKFKTSTLARLGAAPTADLRTVSIDLRQDWPTALQAAGFDASLPTAWNAEGLMIGFLPPDAQDRLLDNITALSVPASRFAGDYGTMTDQSAATQQQMAAQADHWREHGIDIDPVDLSYTGEYHDVPKYLQAKGWDTVGTTLTDLLGAARLPPLQDEDLGVAPASILYVTATRR